MIFSCGWRLAACLILSPLLLGIITKTKALFAGRQGTPLFQVYYDIFKSLQKGSVYSVTTNWLFRAAPLVGLAVVLASSFLMPFAGIKAPFQFTGDVILFAYLFGLARFFMILAAMDTGSSFEGMGAGREAVFSCLSEVSLFINFSALAILSKSFSLSQMIGERSWPLWTTMAPCLILVVISYFMILLVENSRIPVDDPATHLELTMIHEGMVLDHSGPDLGILLYAGAIKLFVLEVFLTGLLLPCQIKNGWINGIVFLAVLTAISVAIGIVESITARLRLNRVPSFIVASFVLASLGLMIALWRTL